MSNRLNLITVGALALALSPAAFAEKLEITGELMTSTCSVDATGGTITVPMGKVDVAWVNEAERAGMKNFSIMLDCSGSGTDQEVGVRFGGTPDGSTGNLAINPGGATGVGVALYDSAGRQQKLGEDPLQWVDIPTGGKGQLDYSAWYSSPAKNATAGVANASGDFVVLYK
ncbi:TPA: fimbrial protein [Stenotrophomonas maltophilia]|nr:fimbrial protein [Stenotrophomonas maltophilia]HDS1677704.1 type 1 fimbrial protein [Stenotrophomonas maltophilia]HEL3816327.1 type 1 fimbrial protein [Stenotrophomonas maltophilia]